jgi:hypothetical protein
MGTKRILLAGIILVTLTFSTAGVAAAQADGPRTGNLAPRGARLYGIVKDIADQSLTLATPVGSVTVLTDANTRLHIPDVEQPNLNAATIELAETLAAGDALGAAGWWETGENTFHAFCLVQLKPDRVFPLAGKVSDIQDDALLVETDRGQATVYVEDKTAYHIHGVAEADWNDDVPEEPAEVLEVGMRIVARGALNPDGSLSARIITVPWVGSRPIRMQGKVLSVTGDTLTFRTARGRQFTVAVDEATEFHVPGVDEPSIIDLEAGDRIIGEGVLEEDSPARATLVLVLPEQVARIVGKVSAIEETGLIIDTPGGQVHILIDADTVLRVAGIEEPTLADVHVDDQVSATGTWEDRAAFHAVGLIVRGDRQAGQSGMVRGRAIQIEGGALVVGTQQGPVMVQVSDDTQYRVPGVDNPDLDDVQIGAAVGVRGAWNEDDSLQATDVAILDTQHIRDAVGRWQ